MFVSTLFCGSNNYMLNRAFITKTTSGELGFRNRKSTRDDLLLTDVGVRFPRVGNIIAEMPTSEIYNVMSANPYFPTSLIDPPSLISFMAARGLNCKSAIFINFTSQKKIHVHSLRVSSSSFSL